MDLLAFLKTRQEQDADLFLHRMFVADQSVVLAGFKSLIDLPQTMMLLQQQARNTVASERPLFALESGIGTCIRDADERRVMEAISEGDLILLPESVPLCIRIVPVNRTLTRAIEAPTTESVLRGPISAFNEDLDTNLGILKKLVVSPRLRTRSFWMGSDVRRHAVLVYMEGRIDPALLTAITQKIESNQETDVPDLMALTRLLGFPKWTLVTRYNTTELPQNAASALSKGKAVLLLDRFPFAIVLPSLLLDMFFADNDMNFPLFYAVSFRFLRMVGVLTNVLLPGLYVALVSVNPEVLRIEIALSIAGSRSEVPYPALVETLLLLLILELTLEASIRLPKTIGPTITMVGGIILGQAVVEAKLVSNILIIILAATTIANFAVIGFHNATTVRLGKYLILFLSAVYGLMGLFVGTVVLCAYIAKVSTFGIPYVYRWRARDRNG
ncbi:spore germination protein [Cohnella caldifontis]|uniref:spore germination protein n=1 Tax=Cohnella caldifontis TaxID=3027471 RepID=UPI0023ED8B6B|nr:spore germination protein [Cohnella sp. YIM B05605]